MKYLLFCAELRIFFVLLCTIHWIPNTVDTLYVNIKKQTTLKLERIHEREQLLRKIASLDDLKASNEITTHVENVFTTVIQAVAPDITTNCTNGEGYSSNVARGLFPTNETNSNSNMSSK